MEAAARPFPSEDTTPPVTRMYFTGRFVSMFSLLRCAQVCKA